MLLLLCARVYHHEIVLIKFESKRKTRKTLSLFFLIIKASFLINFLKYQREKKTSSKQSKNYIKKIIRVGEFCPHHINSAVVNAKKKKITLKDNFSLLFFETSINKKKIIKTENQ